MVEIPLPVRRQTVSAVGLAENDPYGQQSVVSDVNGWKATLNLRFEPTPDKTVLRRSHQGPLMVQRPFYPEGETCHAYVLHPPGGIVGGDHLTVDAVCVSGARGLVTTPGAAKYYGSDGRLAQQQQHISVGDSALEWMPQESIYFDRCLAAQTTRIDLSAGSRFIGWDINCFGRPAGDHLFKSGQVSIRMEVFVDGEALLLERLKVSGDADLHKISGMRGATVNGTMIAISSDNYGQELLDSIRNALPPQNLFSATLIDRLLLIRYLGHSAEEARHGFACAWQVLRPTIIQRQVVVPRIWAT